MKTFVAELDLKDLTVNANSVKDMTLFRLVKDGKISEEVAKEYEEKWQVVIVNKSWFKRWAAKYMFGREAEIVHILLKFED